MGKTYLNLRNKIGYGAGDCASNLFYSFVSSFILLFLTNYIGMDPAIVGTLMMVAKLFDGGTDIIFGFIMDHTHTKMGKARPWMLWSQFGITACQILMFFIPMKAGIGQYVYFFITYTAINAIFFTMNSNSYQALCALITTNKNERVQLGTFRYIFALGTSLAISFVTTYMVSAFGGGITGWRITATIFALAALVINTLSVMSIRELSPTEIAEDVGQTTEKDEKLGIGKLVKLLFTNKYYVICMLIQIMNYLVSGLLTTVGVYYATYNLGNANLFGLLNMAFALPMIIGIVITPALVKKTNNMQKVCFLFTLVSLIASVVVCIAGQINAFPLLMTAMIIRSICGGPTTACFGSLLSEASGHAYRTSGHRVEGAMFSCACFGIKLGSGIATALTGILLRAGGFISSTADQVVTQPASALTTINLLYTAVPIIGYILLVILIGKLDVEKKNHEWDIAHLN